MSNIVLERAELLERVSESSQQISEKEKNYIEKLRLSELRCDRLERDSQATILGLEMKVVFHSSCSTSIDCASTTVKVIFIPQLTGHLMYTCV